MIQINLKNGDTISFDLSTKSGQLGWSDFCSDPSVPSLVSGCGINANNQSYFIPVPKWSKIIGIGGNLLIDPRKDKVSGEFIWYETDKIRIMQTVYIGNNKLSKVEVEKF